MSLILAVFFSLLVCGSAWTVKPLPAAQPVGTPRLCEGSGQLCFSYDRSSVIGPFRWDNICETKFCFNGVNQSPVSINPDQVRYMCGPRLHYPGDPAVDLELTNEGIYPSGTPEDDDVILRGVPGDVDGYRFTNVHMHFRGGKYNLGQEHQLGKFDFDGEMHLVHRSASVSTDDQNLVVGGRAVIAIFLSTTFGERNAELDKILDRIPEHWEYKRKLCRRFFKKCYRPVYGRDYFDNVGWKNRRGGSRESSEENDDDLEEFCAEFFSRPLRCKVDDDACENEDRRKRWASSGRKDPSPDECPDNKVGCIDDHDDECEIEIDDFHPDRLFPTRRNFYYYYGSLTSPPVSEAIRWQVMAEPIKITHRQLTILQQMESREKGVKIVKNGNVRPLQRLNGRQILANFCY